MFLTVHATAGAIIGQASPNLWLAFVIGFISHFLLDLIPHGDEVLIKEKSAPSEQEIAKIKKLAMADIAAMSLVLLSLSWFDLIKFSLPVLAAIAGAILPDLITGFYLLTKFRWLKKYLEFHINLHYLSKKFAVSFRTGLVIQLIFLVLFLIVIILI